MVLSMVSRRILAPSALSIAVRNAGLLAGSAPPDFTATLISRSTLVKILARLASCPALRCLMLAHLLCPAMLTLLRPLKLVDSNSVGKAYLKYDDLIALSDVDKRPCHRPAPTVAADSFATIKIQLDKPNASDTKNLFKIA